MIEICRVCAICKVPEQAHPRIPYLGDLKSKIMILDTDLSTAPGYEKQVDVAHQLFGAKRPFLYTTTIRCKVPALPDEEERVLLSRCGVWTNLLMDGKALLLSTIEGFRQIGIDEAKFNAGEIFLEPKIGVVICIHPLLTLEISEYKPIVRRGIKDSGV